MFYDIGNDQGSLTIQYLHRKYSNILFYLQVSHKPLQFVNETGIPMQHETLVQWTQFAILGLHNKKLGSEWEEKSTKIKIPSKL